MAKSELIKLKQLEMQQQLQMEIVALLKTEISQAILGVVIASYLQRAGVISNSGRLALETASIAFAGIKAAQPMYPVIVQGIKSTGDIIGKVAEGVAPASGALLAA